MKVKHALWIALAVWVWFSWKSAISAAVTSFGTSAALYLYALLGSYWIYGATITTKDAQFKFVRRQQRTTISKVTVIMAGAIGVTWLTSLYFSWVGLPFGILVGIKVAAAHQREFSAALSSLLHVNAEQNPRE